MQLFCTVCLCLGLLIASGVVASQTVKPPVTKTPAKQGPTLIEADTLIGNPQVEMDLTGKAEVKRDKTRITSSTLHIDVLNDTVSTNAGAVLYRDKDILSASTLLFNMTSHEAMLTAPKFFYAKQNGRGEADTMRTDAQRHDFFDKVIYTTCKPGQNDWYLKAKTLELDHTTETGYGKSVALEFFGVPIMALPAMSFPLGNARRDRKSVV